MKITIELDINETSDLADLAKEKFGMASRANLERYVKTLLIDHLHIKFEHQTNHSFKPEIEKELEIARV
jgi:hypothetical protein